MGIYNTVDENVKRIQDFVFGNEKLKRYLFYNEKPLDPSKPIPTFSQINLNNLYPYPNNPEPEDEAKSFINVYMAKSPNVGAGNNIQRDVFIYIDILCHETLWLIEDSNSNIRPYVIMDEIDTKLPLEETPSIRGGLVYVDAGYLQYNKRFCGYRMIYKLTNFSSGCETV